MYDLIIPFDLFVAVFSAVSGVELAMAKEHHKCKIANSFSFIRLLLVGMQR